MTKRLRTFFQRRYTNDQQIHEKVLSIINHQGNTSQNHNELPLHTCQSGYYEKDQKQKGLVGMSRKKNPCALLAGKQMLQPL